MTIIIEFKILLHIAFDQKNKLLKQRSDKLLGQIKHTLRSEIEQLTNKKMKTKEKIEQAITSFVKGGDNSDIVALDKVLHKDFRVANNGFMETLGITIIDKQKYLSNIKEGIFGGLPRKMTIESIDESEIIAIVKLRLESSENYFVSYNSLVLDTDQEWKIIDNLAVVEAKK